jgi:hypothetical protein
MSISRYAGGVVPRKRHHYYAGTDVLLPGYAMCYDVDAANAAATEEKSRLGNLVTKPATANLYAFAGIVAPGAGITGPGYVELVEPRQGVCVDAFSDIDTVKGATALGVANGSYGLTTPTDDQFNETFVATAMETDATLTATSANTMVYLR